MPAIQPPGGRVFYLSYIVSELRRRSGRTVLTALGIGVGVALVVAVTALSNGLDEAQDEVLEPLTGVGTDMSVTRPVNLGGEGFRGLSAKEREQLREENGGGAIRLDDLGEPGEKFTRDDIVSSQLSFPSSTVRKMAGLEGAQDAAAGLTLNVLHVEGTVPERPQGGAAGATPAPPAGGGGPDSVDIDQLSVTGVDESKPSLAPVGPEAVTSGRWLRSGDAREAVVNVSYARRKGMSLGEYVTIKGRKFKIVGIASAPLGGEASDLYVKLDQLQKLSDREGRANVAYVRAQNADAVAGLERRVKDTLDGASVTTSKDLADRIGGSLVDAKNLSNKLGTALEIVGLVAAALIAALLTLSSVAKRTRELGTLKAIGWPQRLVVRQVTGETLLQGALGGVVGAALGIGAAAVITAIGPTLEASVASTSGAPGAGPGGGPGGGPVQAIFGQGQITSGSTDVTLSAPVDFTLILLAVGLAVLCGLLAGAAGSLRAARLRPAAALRHIE